MPQLSLPFHCPFPLFSCADSRGDWGDQDGLQEERRERAFRNRQNKLFRDFVRAAEQTIAKNGQVRKLRAFPVTHALPGGGGCRVRS